MNDTTSAAWGDELTDPVTYRGRIAASWGHCDSAQIIYYPNYFDWFDQCFQALLTAAGLDQRALRERFGIVGTGAVNASGQFFSPVTYGDVLETVSFVESWSERSFTIYHRFEVDGRLAVEGREVRLWLVRTGSSEAEIEACPIPDAFRQLFDRPRS